MRSRFLLHAGLAAAAALTAAGFATASAPSSGKVSTAAPRVEWKGSSTGYLYYNYQRVARTGGQSPRCDAPACDEFTLDVADSADLTISATYETTVFLDFEIVMPDGSHLWVDGSDDKNTTVAKIKKAKPGTYKIQVTTNGTAADDGAFTAFAQLAVPAAPASPAPAAPAVPAVPAPAPAAPSSAQLTIRTRAGSARKRSLAVALATTAPLTDVQAFLRKGKKVVAKGRMASLAQSGKVTLKLPKKLKPGAYTLAVSAKTQAGGLAAASAPFKLKR
jgi:hypothetical protein